MWPKLTQSFPTCYIFVVKQPEIDAFEMFHVSHRQSLTM
jgi:hypothetical protein